MKLINMMSNIQHVCYISMLFLIMPVAVFGTTPSLEEMWEIIQQQQRIIEELTARLDNTDQKVTSTETRIEETAQEVELTADALEAVQETGTVESGWSGRSTFGGYGELHYNNLEDDNNQSGGDDSLDRVDFHRFVLFFGHQFTDSIHFFSELELEHALVADDGSTPGEVELEQAWIEMDINDFHRFRTGLDILPVGLINVTHEPNTFFGVERNRVESEIIPTTWWEAVAGLNGEIAPGWNYDVIAHSGLKTPITGSSTLRPRSGRSKIAEADDLDIAFTGRLRYTGFPGLEIGVSGQYQNDMTGTADAFDVDATLFEGHMDYRHNSGLGFRALYARWDFDVPAGITFTQDHIDGWYLEPAYRFDSPGLVSGEFGVFARYSEWDQRGQGEVPDGTFVRYDMWNIGFNWWPHENVVFKFDYQNESTDMRADAALDGINLGMGYQF